MMTIIKVRLWISSLPKKVSKVLDVIFVEAQEILQEIFEAEIMIVFTKIVKGS